MIYSSKHNDFIKSIASLKNKNARNESGLFVIEGRKMVNEAIAAGKRIKYVVMSDKYGDDIPKGEFEIVEVTEDVFKFISEEMTPQGILAVVYQEMDQGSVNTGNFLVLDRISDPGNMGTIIRSAASFGYNDIYLINCVDPYNGKTVRASMSGIYFVRLHKISEDEVKKYCSGTLIAADMSGENIKDSRVTGQFGIVIGNEANGVSDYLMSLADKVISIPMSDKMESLNAAVAGSIMMFTLK